MSNPLLQCAAMSNALLQCAAIRQRSILRSHGGADNSPARVRQRSPRAQGAGGAVARIYDRSAEGALTLLAFFIGFSLPSWGRLGSTVSSQEAQWSQADSQLLAALRTNETVLLEMAAWYAYPC